jgi:hypothetical protein
MQQARSTERRGLARVSRWRSACALSQAAYAVILMTVGEETAYVAVPAPRFPGQSPSFAPPGTEAPPGSVETGRIGVDVAVLAGRTPDQVVMDARASAQGLVKSRSACVRMRSRA